MRIKILTLSAALFASSLSAQTVVPRSAANVIVIPAAGSVQGGNGTFFRSDVTLLNFRASTQRVELQWLPQGGGSPSSVFLDLGALSGFNSEDFVASVLHQSGLGAVVVTGVTPTGAVDPSAQLVVSSRIWTEKPGAAGTESQQFNAVPLAETSVNASLYIIGQRRDSRYRTNVGVVNLGSTPRSFRIQAAGGSGPDAVITIDIPPQSLMQVPLSGADSGAPLQIVVSPVTASSTSRYIAYGSSVDNVTGDAWSSLGFPPVSSNP